MNMAKNFQELRAGMSSTARAASAAEHRRLVEEMSLLQLRKARELTQTKIADELHMGQGDVSKLERRTDMYVSTLASYLQAVGADLEIRGVSRWARCERSHSFPKRRFNEYGHGNRRRK
jgi:DNA-binding transcriptional regulator YiaG